MIPRLAALGLLSCAAAVAADEVEEWTRAGFEEVEIQTFELDRGPTPPPERALDLTAVVLKGSNWTFARVERHLRKTAAVLEPCGVGLGRARIVRARAPGGDHDVAMADAEQAVPPEAVRLASLVPASADRPLVFFVGRLLGDDSLARSFGRGEVPREKVGDYPYMNTAWIAYKTHWIERADRGYSTLAHETAHLLCECGHEGGEERHLLHEHRNFLSTRVLERHCAMFRSSPLTRPWPRTGKR